MESCFKCGGRTVKNGSVNGRPKRKCVTCNFQSVGEDNRGKPEEVRHFGVLLHSHGLSLNAVGKLVGVSATEATGWSTNSRLANPWASRVRRWITRRLSKLGTIARRRYR